jgi:hypothetical protein
MGGLELFQKRNQDKYLNLPIGWKWKDNNPANKLLNLVPVAKGAATARASFDAGGGVAATAARRTWEGGFRRVVPRVRDDVWVDEVFLNISRTEYLPHHNNPPPPLMTHAVA